MYALIYIIKYGITQGQHMCDPSARNESHVGSVQVEKMGSMYDMGQ